MAGFDACRREVTDCLSQSQNVNISPVLYSGLLTHLATCRRLLTTSSATVPPPRECTRLRVDENTTTTCLQTTKTRQMRAATGEDKRSPLLSIANIQPVVLSATESNIQVKPNPSCTDVITDDPIRGRLMEHTSEINVDMTVVLQSDTNCSRRTEGPVSRDVMEENDSDCLATNDEFRSPMWRPW